MTKRADARKVRVVVVGTRCVRSLHRLFVMHWIRTREPHCDPLSASLREPRGFLGIRTGSRAVWLLRNYISRLGAIVVGALL